MTVITGSDNTTRLFSQGVWHGQIVWVEASLPDEYPCLIDGHDLDVMTNYGTPTELLICSECVGMAKNPECA